MHLDDLLYRYALTYEETWARELATELKQHNVWVTSTLGEILREESLGKVNYQQHPERKYVFPGMWQTWDPELGHRHPMKDEQRQQYAPVEEKAYAFIKLMQSAKVGLLAGSDSGATNSFSFPGWTLHQELELLVASGLTPMEALQTTTRNPARF